MSVDLGDLAGLAGTLGLIDTDGNPRAEWFADPGKYLKQILSDTGQRSALLQTVDDILGGSEATADERGRTWVPLFENPPLAVSLVLGEADGGASVHIGLGARLRSTPAPGEVGFELDAHLPLFAANGDSSTPWTGDPLLLGTAGAVVEVAARLALPPSAAPGGIVLAGVELSARIPTAGAAPDVGFALRGLRLPGADSARDVVVDVDSLDELDDALLELVLGLVQSATGSMGAADPAHGLAGLLGLVAGDAVPDFPVALLASDGPIALARWWAACLAGSARTVWLGHLATLLGGSVQGAGPDATVRVPLGGGVDVVVALVSAAGAAGLPVVTPRISVQAAGGPGTSLRLQVDPVSVDLATGAAVSVPALSLLARMSSGGAGPLLGPVAGPQGLSITIGSFEGGFALNADRRPSLVLTARNATVGSTPYESLDLTDGDALAAVAGQAVAAAAASLLTALGPLGGTVAVLLGLADPAGAVTPRIDPVRLLADPLGALRDRWAALFATSPATVRSVLQTWQEATAAAALRTRAVSGDGTPAAPYRVAVAAGIDLLVTVAGTSVSVALAAEVSEPIALGAAATVDVRFGIARLDLSATGPRAEFGIGAAVVLALTGEPGTPLRLVADGYGLSLAGVGVRIGWTPADGVRVDPWLDQPALIAGGMSRPLTGIGVGGAAALALPLEVPVPVAAWSAPIWAAVESLTGTVVASATRRRTESVGAADPLTVLLSAAADLTGWASTARKPAARLSLAALADDPAAELRRWARLLLAVDGGRSRVPELVIGLLGELLGLPGVSGAGTGAHPWSVPLPGAGRPVSMDASVAAAGAATLGFGLDLPALLISLGTPSLDRFGSRAPLPLLQWRPGDEGLDSALLVGGIVADAEIDDVLADAMAGRGPVADGFEALIDRWTGTDGVVGVAEDALPDGLAVHRPSELVHTAGLDSARVREALSDVWEELGGAPDRLVLVGVVAEGEPDVLPRAGDNTVSAEVDLTLAGAQVEAFAVPVAAPVGTTVVRLAGRAAAAVPGGVDGFAGQVARLHRALGGLSGAGSIVVVAGAAAGRAAVAAAAGLPGVAAVVTVGTAWTPVSLADVDISPAADGVRMLRTLLDLADEDLAAELSGAGLSPEEVAELSGDDEDLALARGLVGSLLARDERSDPLTEMSAPEQPLPTGLAVHAVIGSCSPESVRRAITAAVAAGLAGRSRRRTTGTGTGTAAVGLHLPAGLGTAIGGLRVALGVDADLLRHDPAGAVAPELRIRLRFAADGRWLVGGPDPVRAPGSRPLALRAVTLDLSAPLPPWGSQGAAPTAGIGRLVLHDATAFGVRRARWVVDMSADAPLLPEVRALLGELAVQLRSQALGSGTVAVDPAITGLVDALTAVGLLDPSGGFDPLTVAALLADPARVLQVVLADATRATALAAGLRRALGDLRTDADEVLGSTLRLTLGSTMLAVDLAARSLTVGSSADLVTGTLRAGLDVTVNAAGATIGARLGAAALLPAGVPSGPPAAGPVAAALILTANLPKDGAAALSVSGTVRDPRGVHDVAVWPAGPATAAAVMALLPDAAAATAIQAGLTALRSSLISIEPPGGPVPADLVDAVLSAAGLLRGTGNDRRVVWPSGLATDPRAWLEVAVGDLSTSLPDIVTALAGLLPTPAVALPPGSLPIAEGVTVRAASSSGRLTLLLDLDSTRFAGAGPDLDLRLAAGVSMAATGGTGRVLPDVSLDVGAASMGTVQVRVGTLAGGSDPTVGVTVAVAPLGRSAITLYPGGPGLSGLADSAAAGAIAALPALLTRLAAEDPAGAAPATTPAQVAGRIVGRAGTALGLATGTPAVFSAAALSDFAADPAAALTARAAAVTAAGLEQMVDAVQAVLGAVPGRSVTAIGGRVQISIGPVDRNLVIGWTPATGSLDAAATVGSIPAVGRIVAAVTAGPTGIRQVDVAVGPASIPIDTVTLSPFARVVAGSDQPARVDLGLGAGPAVRLVARLDGDGVTLLSATGLPTAPVESTSADDVAAAVVAAVLELAGGMVLGITEVEAALTGAPVLGPATAAELLDGVLVLTGPLRFDPDLAADITDAAALLLRLGVLAGNIADAMVAPVHIGGVLDVSVSRDAGGVIGLTIDLTGDEWIVNPDGDIQVGIVTDAAWIDPPVPAGITVGVVKVPPGGPVEFAPGLAVGGLGVRVSRGSGPLLDAGISLQSLSVLGFGLVRSTGAAVALGGGARIELTGIGIPLAGASGGDNAVAQGVMPAGGSGDDAPAPRFSPALSVQKHPGSGFAVSLSAGTGSGPWWLGIQREFGPIYLEQVGLAVGQDGTKITSIAVLIDGKVTLFGLSASVDDLSLTLAVNGSDSPFDPSSWTVDVAGFAVTAETGGLTLAGGLRKFPVAEGGVEYLGMLLARLGVYGLTVYGGFGRVGPPDDQYASLFLFGAVNGPLGGPPAFFVTGIGGGFGANRGLVVPADLSQFGNYPLIKALDPAARAGDPFTELAQARGYFPAERGQFWFAAGISFTSFALVDGVVVVAVSFGNGFELNILGLARMALPRPQVALISIELALVARVSTREGVVLVQAQLTDNSWLIAPAVRLTGGFAFASWFAGPNRGQFVLTLGGYHPDFHRDGYPVVPRLGLIWRIGDFISVSGQSYFALTSEALMAGLKVEIHAQLGPAWAHLVFGADGIVYFDPFWLKVTIYASVDAGITIDLWFAEVTISVHLSARLTVTGPPFHAVATLEIGPVDVTFEIGDDTREPAPISWTAFVAKYLEEAAPGLARALTAITGVGTVPPAGTGGAGGDTSPDGQPDRPFRVVAEFTAVITTTLPIRELGRDGDITTLTTSHIVSVAPMGKDGTAKPRVTVLVRRRLTSGSGAGGPDPAAPDRVGGLQVTARRDGAFPIGAWGAAQDLSNPKIPAGDVLNAANGIELVASAVIPGTGPGETPPPNIPYRQVETGRRRVLPLLPATEAADRARVLTAVARLRTGLAEAIGQLGGDHDNDLAMAAQLLVSRGERSELAVADWRAGLAAPVMLGTLGEGLGGSVRPVTVVEHQPPAAEVTPIRPPRVLAVLSSAESRADLGSARREGAATAAGAGRTSVSPALLRQVLDRDTAVPRVVAPTRAGVAAGLSTAIPARLVDSRARARVVQRTVVATGAVPMTAAGIIGGAALGERTAAPQTLAALAGRTESLLADGTTVAGGQVLVAELPDADVDTDDSHRPLLICRDGLVRVVLLGAAGRVLTDTVLTTGASAEVPVGARTAVLVGGPTMPVAPAPWSVAGGWSASRPLPSASDGLLVGAGCVLDVLGQVPYRGPGPVRSAWVAPSELSGSERGSTTVLAGPGGAGADRPPVLAALAVMISGASAEGLAIGLDGAEQAGPAVVTTDRSGAGVLVIGLRGVEPGAPVAVTVAAGSARTAPQVLGVLAAAGDTRTLKRDGAAAAADWLAAAVADGGVAALAAAPTVPGPATSVIAWEVR